MHGAQMVNIVYLNHVKQCQYKNTRPGYSPISVYRYVPPQRVGFLSRFGLKTGIDFQHFGLKLGMVIGGNVHESL